MNYIKKYFILIIILALTWNLTAQNDGKFDINSIPNPKVHNGTNVSVIGNYMSQTEIDGLNTEIASIEKDNKIEIAVVVVPNTGGDEFGVSQEIFDKWGIGKKGTDSGLLILLSVDEGKIRTHTGYGLEEVLPDAYCLTLQNTILVPLLKQKKYGEGLLNYIKKLHEIFNNSGDAVSLALKDKAENEKLVQIENEKKLENKSMVFYLFNILNFISLLLLLFFVIKGFFEIKNKSKEVFDSFEKVKNIYKNSMIKTGSLVLVYLFSGIPVICFIVILINMTKDNNVFIIIPIVILISDFLLVFSLLTSNSKLKNKVVNEWRSKPRMCPICKDELKKLSESKEDELLNHNQQIEENLKTVDYDVWLCDNCKYSVVENYELFQLKYNKCVQCDSISYSLDTSEITRHSSYISEGERRLTYSCKACGHKEVKYQSIPKLQRSSGSSSGSSSSSSGGSSFGGGRSGGGGATSSF